MLHVLTVLLVAWQGFAIWAGMRRQGFPNLRQASPVQTAALAVLPAAHAAQATLSRQEAQQLLQRWEGVKQEALGSALCPCESAELQTYARTKKAYSVSLPLTEHGAGWYRCG